MNALATIARGQTDLETIVRETTVRASEKVRIQVPVRKAIGRVSIAISRVLRATGRVSIGPGHHMTGIAPAPANGRVDLMEIARVPAATVRASIRIVPARMAIVHFAPLVIAPVSTARVPPETGPRVPVEIARFALQVIAPVSIARVPPEIDLRVPKVIVRVQPAIVPRARPAVVAVPGPAASALARIAAAVPVRPAVSVPSPAARANHSIA
jgi:hypothetical protein